MAGSHKALRRRWSQRELAMLEDMAGDLPFPLLIKRFNRWAATQGLPPRSRRSIAHKIHRMGLSLLSGGEWIAVGEVAKALNRWPSTIWDWSERGLVRRFHLSTASAVSRKDLKRLARTQPHLFGGASRDGLMQVLENADLADSIRERFPTKAAGYGGTRRVRWVDRDIVFPSIRAAANAVHVTESAIRGGMQKNRPVAGWWFEPVD